MNPLEPDPSALVQAIVVILAACALAALLFGFCA